MCLWCSERRCRARQALGRDPATAPSARQTPAKVQLAHRAHALASATGSLHTRRPPDPTAPRHGRGGRPPHLGLRQRQHGDRRLARRRARDGHRRRGRLRAADLRVGEAGRDPVGGARDLGGRDALRLVHRDLREGAGRDREVARAERRRRDHDGVLLRRHALLRGARAARAQVHGPRPRGAAERRRHQRHGRRIAGRGERRARQRDGGRSGRQSAHRRLRGGRHLGGGAEGAAQEDGRADGGGDRAPQLPRGPRHLHGDGGRPVDGRGAR